MNVIPRVKLDRGILIAAITILLFIPIHPFVSGSNDIPEPTVPDMGDDVFFGTLDLSQTTMEQYITGNDPGDHLGYAIEKADLNRDGKDDVILGAPGYNYSCGGVFIYFGGSLSRILDNDHADVIIEHYEVETFFGLKVKVGDVNNDGFIDILVAGYADEGYDISPSTEYPKVFLFLGTEVWPSRISTLDADSTFIGTSNQHLFGWDIAVGDVTDDGYDDILISELEPAPSGEGGGGGPSSYDDESIHTLATPSSSGGGSGTYGPTSMTDLNEATMCWVSTSTGGTGYFALQWDQDYRMGKMKVIIHGPNSSPTNRHLAGCDVEYWDGDSWVLDSTLEGITADFEYEFVKPRKTSAIRLYNLVVTGTQASNPCVYQWYVYEAKGGGGVLAPNGSVYMFEGANVLQREYNVSLGMELGMFDHIITDSVNNSGLGYTDLDLGDVNGDGYQDILIGSGGMQYEGINAGGAQVVYGGAELPAIMDLSKYSHLNITSFPGFKLSYITHGDINGDGIEDIITCAPYAFTDFTGGIFAFYGNTLLPTGHLSIIDNDFLIRGPVPGWEFNVGSAGDMNNDGRDDLWIRSNSGFEENPSGIYYLLYMNQTDDLPDPSKYLMQFVQPSYRVMAPSGGTSFGYFTNNGLITLDYDGDGRIELIVSDYDGSVQGSPKESGGAYIHYQEKSEIRILDFDIMAWTAQMGILCVPEKRIVSTATLRIPGHWKISGPST